MTTREDREAVVRDAIQLELTDRGWSAAELARRAKIRDSSTVRDFINGARWPTLATQGKVERALRWHLGAIRDVLGGDDPPPLGGDVDDREVVEQIAGLTPEERAELLLAVDRADARQQRALLEVWRAISDTGTGGK